MGIVSMGFEHSFFRIRWRRTALVTICLVWAGVELLGGSWVWAIVFGALGLTAAWQFHRIWSGSEPGSDTLDGEENSE